MIQMRPLLLAVLSAIVLASPVSAQVLWRMDYTPQASPAGGWEYISNRDVNVKFRQTFVLGGGPTGDNAYELTQLFNPGGSYYGGQFYWGWGGFVEPQDPPRGAARYYRFRMRFSSNSNLQSGSENPLGLLSPVSNKILMVGDGCTQDPCRVILNYLANQTTWNGVEFFRIQTDGGENPGTTGQFLVGTWLNIQVELRSSTTASSGNGSYKIWINNNNYNSPNAQVLNLQLNPSYWRMVHLGAYENGGLYVTGVHSFRLASFEVAGSFDLGWNRDLTVPSAPVNLRIVP